jgi:crotonobetainyl-CoA:carnitine CoA-transferase CaiB-like acyl-CoA transferase
VLEFMWVVAGPWSTRYLADYGATVIKIESTSHVDTIRTISPFKDHVPGPERSGAHATVNAGKLGVTLNLGHPKGHEIALKLAAWADVVTESFAPGAMKKFGLDYASLRRVNPDLIMVSSCLNGQSGPQCNLAGFGTMGQYLAGFGGLAGWPDRPPAGAPGAYTDYIAPKFTASAILAALDFRRRTGKGQYIDVSQGEASTHFLGSAFLDYTVNGHVTGRRGNASPDFAPHGVYPLLGDDCWVAIVVTNEAQWRGICGVLGAPLSGDSRFATLEARLENREALDAAVGAWTATREAGNVEERLQAAGVPVHRTTTSSDAFVDPQLQTRGHFVTVEHPELGPVPIENSRMRLSATPARVASPGPTFGQHNQRVLTEILGMSEEEFVELLAEGVLE